MPDGTEDTFDADLTAMLNGGGDQPTQQDVEQNQPTEASKLKFGGREWDTPEKLGKAYEALHKDYTRKSQDYAKLKPYGDFDAYLNKHPELRKSIAEKVKEYNSRVAAGQSETTAQRATGVAPEYAERIERMEAFFEDQKLEREIDQVKAKFNLDRDDVKIVLHKAAELAEKGAVLPLSDVYKILSYEQKTLDAKKDGERGAIDKLNLKRKANVGSSDATTVTPNAKSATEMNNKEYDQALGDRLSQLGYSG